MFIYLKHIFTTLNIFITESLCNCWELLFRTCLVIAVFIYNTNKVKLKHTQCTKSQVFHITFAFSCIPINHKFGSYDTSAAVVLSKFCKTPSQSSYTITKKKKKNNSLFLLTSSCCMEKGSAEGFTNPTLSLVQWSYNCRHIHDCFFN